MKFKMNRFYDLPVEIINKIYNMDHTYKKIYDEVVDIIKKFPVFYKIEKEYYVFLKEYNFDNDIPPFEEYLSVSKKCSFKKSIFIIIEKMSKPNTLISNNSKIDIMFCSTKRNNHYAIRF